MTSSEHRISASLRRSIDGQLEEGLRALEEQATELMREIAAEIWRASGNDMRPEQERIVSLLSRDQTIKTLIASSDERFQALALRSARVEDSMNEVAETGRTSRDAIEASLLAIREIADSPTLARRRAGAHAARAGRAPHRRRRSPRCRNAIARSCRP